jgi:hypothetical protein
LSRTRSNILDSLTRAFYRLACAFTDVLYCGASATANIFDGLPRAFYR